MAGYLGPKAIQYNVDNSNVENDSNVGGDLTVGGSFTSRGIDDNATSTAMTLDSDGNVLVGKTLPSFSAEGFKFGAAGKSATFTRNDDIPMFVRRNGTYGTIADFNQDGSNVGSIGSRNINDTDVLFIQFNGTGNAVGLTGTGTSFNAIIPCKNEESADDIVNLGVSNARFKDLYLSGGVYLGGTGSSNYLDSYEAGTWTLNLSGFALNYTDITQQANYVKVGELVTVRFYVRFTSSQIGSGDVEVNLPFTPEANKSAAGSISRHVKGTAVGADFDQIGLRILGGDPYIQVVRRNNGGTTGGATRSEMFADGASNILEGTISYFTAS
jgi:hypothetical protein